MAASTYKGTVKSVTRTMPGPAYSATLTVEDPPPEREEPLTDLSEADYEDLRAALTGNKHVTVTTTDANNGPLTSVTIH